MQEVTAEGLRPASEADQRYHIECIYTASMEFDGAKLKATWATKTPKEAHEVLSMNDIQVSTTRVSALLSCSLACAVCNLRASRR